MSNLYIANHPLITHKLTLLRDIATQDKEFRELTSELTMLLCYEATRGLKLKKVNRQTPVEHGEFGMLENEKFTIVPIFRAGVGMMESMLSLLPKSKIGMIGLYRNEETLVPVKYYNKLPKNIASTEVFLIDPMLATGGTAIAAANHLKEAGCRKIKFICLIASPEGIEAFQKAHDDIDIFVGARDRQLNAEGYIVPGLGDAGDRIFGTV